MEAGLNLEFARTENMSFDQALRAANDAGYRWVEPYVYTPVALTINSHLRLTTDTPYCHVNTDTADTAAIRAQCEQLGVAFSAVDAHCSLLLPGLSVPYLKAAIDFAAGVACPVVMSDEGPLAPEWMDLDRAFDQMCFALEPIVDHARNQGITYAVELHNALTARPRYLKRLLERFGPREVGVNFDTGNAFLAGNDPVAYLAEVADRVVHVHIKDIPASQLSERGTVTGTRVGVAADDGVVDLPGIVRILRTADYAGVLSVECDTLDQASAHGPSIPPRWQPMRSPTS